MTRSVPTRKQAARGSSTRDAILQSAATVFERAGYHRAGVRDIAEAAGVNLAAVHYHFGSKEGLYLALLQQLAAAAVARYPVAPPGQELLPREQRLRVAVRNFLSRFMGADPVPLLPRLLVLELAHPTPALDTLLQTLLQPQLVQLMDIVRAFVGEQASPAQMQRAVFSLVGQCLFFLFGRPLVSRLAAPLYEDPREFDALAEHVARFCIAGLEALRRDIDQENAT